MDCKNIGAEYDAVDEFLCSKCGIHLMEWVRIDEEDYADGIVHEYAFRYCPNCGAKIVDEMPEYAPWKDAYKEMLGASNVN